jgi:tetratricopeptide (TPR) repeat protein
LEKGIGRWPRRRRGEAPRRRRSLLKKTILLILMGTLTLWAAAPTTDISLLEKYRTLLGAMDKARASFEKGNLSASEKDLDKCLKAVPDHHEAHYFKAQIRYKQGDFAKGLEHMLAAESGYAHFAAVMEAARVDKMLKDVEKEQALSDLIPALEKAYDQSICKPPTYQAAIIDAKNKLDETKNDKPDALRKNKSAAPAEYLYFHGNCLFRMNRYEEAEAEYKEALAADPAHANANNNLISLLYGQKRYAEALACLEQAEAQKVQVQAGLKKAVLDAAKK